MVKTVNRRVLSALWQAIWAFRLRSSAAVGLLICAKLASVAVPGVLKRIVDDLSRPEQLGVLPVFLLIGYALMRFSGTLFSELRDLVFARVTQCTVSDFTLRAFTHLHVLGARFHSQRQTGELIRDVERGTQGISFLLGVALFTIVPTLVEIGAVVAILLLGYSPWYSAIIAATFIVYVTCTLVFTEKRVVHQRVFNELDSRASGHLVDSMLNYEAVKFYTNEGNERSRFAGITDRLVDVGVRNQKALTTLHVLQSGVIAVGVAAVMLRAGEDVVLRILTVGDLVLINAYVIQICLPLNSLGFTFRESRDALISAERLFGLLDRRPEIEDQRDARDLRMGRADVRFEHIDFSYEPSRQVLYDVDFALGSGQTVAVVGGSGSGKSTLARLLLRFYDVPPGPYGKSRILIDEQDIRTVTQKSLRSAIGIVPQDTILFNDTIAYNIGYGRPGAGLSEVIEAAKAAHVHDFIAALPEQYSTPVGERGMRLSGGERQRIAIARAILKNPPILILDEATSALDTRSERAIHEQLVRLSADRTTLTIAHRLSTIVNADQILVMERGRIVERGRHVELIERDGLYTRMWRLQQQEEEVQRAGLRMALQPTNLMPLLAAVLDGLKQAVEERGVDLYTVIDAQSGRVMGDPGQLQKVLWDLCGHVLATVPRGGRVELRLERDGPNARLAVGGTRIMSAAAVPPAAPDDVEIPPEIAPAAEPPFDLSSVRQVMLQHRGSLDIVPGRDGIGNIYQLEMPLRAVDTEAVPVSARRISDLASPEPRLGGLSIMVVDDQADAREALVEVLRVYGARVQDCDSGYAVLARLTAARNEDWPDVLLCDINLGDEDGYAVLNRLRLLEAERDVPLDQRLPAIALTGLSRPEDRVRALLAGFQSHLVKPVDPRELAATVTALAKTRAVQLPPSVSPARGERPPF